MGECFFWYRPTRVVPDKRPLNGCCCCCCCCCRTSSFCTVAWQLARFQLTRRTARSLGDSGASSFNSWRGSEPHFASLYQISQRLVKPLQIYRDFCDFQDAGCRHIGFSKILNFNGRSATRGQCASLSNFIKIGQTVAEIWF